jgi:hypothetical protein
MILYALESIILEKLDYNLSGCSTVESSFIFETNSFK